MYMKFSAHEYKYTALHLESYLRMCVQGVATLKHGAVPQPSVHVPSGRNDSTPNCDATPVCSIPRIMRVFTYALYKRVVLR